MFYYYGRKKQIARHYPDPACSLIIEPFAGAAAYSLYGDHWRNDVLLVEKDPRVAEIWDWLIGEATPRSILQLPDLKIGEKSSEFLHIVHAATKMAFAYKTIKVTAVLERNWEISKRVMANNVRKVKHWRLLCGDYTEAPDTEATWFIDPPYKGQSGVGYRFSSEMIDYAALARWAFHRQGEIIFCEGGNADYLPFKPLLELKGVAGKSSTELLYYRSNKSKPQKDLFRTTGGTIEATA